MTQATTSNIYVGSGQTLSGGSFTDTILSVASGGEVSGALLRADTRAYVGDGGTAVAVGVFTEAFISGGVDAVLSADTIHAGGVQILDNIDRTEPASAGAFHTVILSGGMELISRGARSTSATISAGGLQQPGLFSFAADTTVASGGELQLFFGTASDIRVERGGELDLAASGFATGIVMAGAVAVALPDLYDVPTLSGLTIASGGTLALIGGATEIGATIAPGGTLTQDAIGIFKTVGEDQLLIAAGNSFSPTLGFGMSAFVYSGGVLNAPVIGSGGDAVINGGGRALNAIVQSGGILDVSGLGVALDPKILSGGTLGLGYDGLASGAVIAAGGTAMIGRFSEGPGTFTDTTLAGLMLLGGMVANHTTVLSGAELQASYALTSATTIDAGGAYLALSATADDTVVAKGGQLTVEARDSSTFSGGTIDSGGILTFVSNYFVDTFTDFTIAAGGTLVELAGATEHGLTIAPGAIVISAAIGLFTGEPTGSPYPHAEPAQLVSAADTLAGATVSPWGYLQEASGGRVTGLTIDTNGRADIFGGTLQGAIVAGALTVEGGNATDLTIAAGGNAALYGGGRLVSTTIASGGGQSVQSGSLIDTIVSGGGVQYVYGGLSQNTDVLSGGLIDIQGGGAFADDTIIAAGGTVLVSHGTLTYATLTPGGTIDLRYAQFASGGSASINSADLLTITEGGFGDRYTLQLAGTYTADSFYLAADSRGGTLITLSATPRTVAPQGGSDQTAAPSNLIDFLPHLL